VEKQYITHTYALEVAEQVIQGINSCGHALAPEMADIVVVTHAYDSNDAQGGTERDGSFVALLRDGRWVAAWDSEDYTGHGCQCSGGADYFATQEEALRLGGMGYGGEPVEVELATAGERADALVRLEQIKKEVGL
jgi:hypothetical protein